MHLLQCFGEMVQEQKVHFMPLLGGLLAAAITTLDAESLQYNKASHDGHEANKVAKLVAVRTSASLCVRPHLWQPPDHLDPILIKGVTDTAKRTQLYLELNALAMNRITPLLTERALAFSHRANVRPIPLSKNERSFFFQLMTFFPFTWERKGAKRTNCSMGRCPPHRAQTPTLRTGKPAQATGEHVMCGIDNKTSDRAGTGLA